MTENNKITTETTKEYIQFDYKGVACEAEIFVSNNKGETEEMVQFVYPELSEAITPEMEQYILREYHMQQETQDLIWEGS